MGAELERLGEQCGGVDVGIAVDLAVAEERGVFEEPGMRRRTRACSAELEVVLEADRRLYESARRFLAKLDHGSRARGFGLGIGEADGLHGAETEGVAAPAGGFLDGETTLKVLNRFRVRDARGRKWPGAVGRVESVGVLRLRCAALRMTTLGRLRGELLPKFGGDGFGGGEASRKRSYSSLVKGQLM